ncbi:endonuclease [Amphritea sp. HPY]|uniref:endonuclease n=1 Tax=Amphritea sp. HPY TaxID=3421652 RepID=UPI003D7F0401
MKRLISLTAALLLATASANADPLSFSSAKKRLAKLYSDNQSSFYCGCDYSSVTKESGKGKKLAPDWSTCGFTPRKQEKRASRIEWEHVMPAHHFGQHLQCWRDGGRKNCKKDPTFRAMEGDMHNLVPAIGEVNGDRSNFKYGMLEGEARVYGKCDAEVNFKAKRFEPAPAVRGDIARTYFYMSDKYKVSLSKQQRMLFEAWDKADPIDQWELEKSQRVADIQGNANPYVK